MRQTCLDMVHELARRDERVVFIGSDLSPGLLAGMKEELPGRWFMEGVCEQNVVGLAAGMAMDGCVPYVNTIATFLTRRCYEQVAIDACLHDLPIRLIAHGGGLVYAPLGPTHLAIEDLAIMRALPNTASRRGPPNTRRPRRSTRRWPPAAPFIEVAYGEALVFSQNVLHGNRVNEEPETRWSMNCRFKSALSPYADKKLGEFFEPITLRPATRLGLRYRLPDGFDG
jgi:hypothetical protein